MLSSTVHSSCFPDTNPTKRRKVDTTRSRSTLASTYTDDDNVSWRSQSRQRIYSAKLVEALFRHRNIPSVSVSSGGGDVRGIADRVLATEAKGRTRWSRAILASRRVRVTALWRRRHPRGVGRGGRMMTAFERRVKVLGRLVPGCRGISVTRLLEEATDYIAALEMQVKAMAALSQLLGSGHSQ